MNTQAPNSNGHSDSEERHTSASTWRKARLVGESIVLPSGHRAVLKPVSLEQLLEEGKIPDILTPIAAQALWMETDAEKISKNEDLHLGFLELINLVIPFAVLSPKVVEFPEEGKEEISLVDIDFIDKIAIFNLAIQPANVLKNFRKEQEASMESTSNSEDVRISSK